MNRLLILVFMLLGCMNMQGNAKRTSVVVYGANGKDGQDDTKAIQQAINSNDTIDIPKGVYWISSLIIGDNKVIMTDGFSTVLKQLPNNIGKQIIRIEGSYVTLYPMAFEGNIATDTSEFNYAVFVVPPLNKNTSNIVVKGVMARDLRGDAVSVGNSGTTFPEHVLIENVTVRNCYRNGISVVGGRNVIIRNVDVQNSGMQGIDIEAEGGELTALEDIVIENVKAGNICISGREQRVRRVVCRNLELDGLRQLSNPRYKPMQNAGIIVYNAEDVHFDNVTISNMPGFAVFAGDIYERYDLLSEKIRFTKLKITKSALSDRVYNAYICVMGMKSLVVEDLSAVLQADHILLLGKANTINESQMVTVKGGGIKNGQLVAKFCSLKAEDLTIEQSASWFQCMNEIELNNCHLSGKAPSLVGGQKTDNCSNAQARGTISISKSTYNKKPLKIAASNEHAWLK